MQLCVPDPPLLPPKRPSIIEAKHRIKVDHDECCNCCCCTSQRICYKYVQPEIPKPFTPIRHYWKSDLPMEKNTTYNLSYWECPSVGVEPILPRNSLVTGDGEISDQTTYKCSYYEHCAKPEPPIIPCDKQWLGRGPMQDLTTQKHDFTWKRTEPAKPYRARDNIYCQAERLAGKVTNAHLDLSPLVNLSSCDATRSFLRTADDTTYRLSYFEPCCSLPSFNYTPVRSYLKPELPMEDCTTYRLSYWPNDCSNREEPICEKQQYMPPVEPMEACTTYRLSYWPETTQRPSPIYNRDHENILNAHCCNDTNTTYNLSYFGCGGDTRTPIRQRENVLFPSCPIAYDTIHKMSFLGNWCPKPDAPITPCDKQWLGKGPVQRLTTQKHDFTWKNVPLEPNLRRAETFTFSEAPIDRCTTYKLSYFENDCKSLTPTLNFAPIRSYRPPDMPTETETTMRLSYQPVDCISPVEKPWSENPAYELPTVPMEDATTYKESYIPPGTLRR